MGTGVTFLTMTLILVTAEVGRGYMMNDDMEDDAVLDQLVELSARYCQPHFMKSVNYRCKVFEVILSN